MTPSVCVQTNRFQGVKWRQKNLQVELIVNAVFLVNARALSLSIEYLGSVQGKEEGAIQAMQECRTVMRIRSVGSAHNHWLH